jgi:glutathione-regulated potassium-efflux system ancillary protein KefC/glutathione-regulated potassium-efflux system protein KefB
MLSLVQVALFLTAAVLFVPLFKKLGLGAVLGYLGAGIALGPYGFGAVQDPDSILQFSQFGVVFLLFVIGLELKPRRLWVMRHHVFGLGGVQVVATAMVFLLAGRWLGFDWATSVIAGFGLALSSTAFVLPLLAENNELATPHGRASFAILLFQDLAVIPALAILPVLAYRGAPGAGPDTWATLLAVAKAAALLAAVLVGGRYLLRPVFRTVADTRIHEIFVAAALLVVIGTAALMDWAGLSMSLGAFLAGVLLADSEYRHELQADIEPFKGLLLGLFFMAVGMSANFGVISREPLVLGALVLGFGGMKASLLYGLGRAARLGGETARRIAFALPQGGEFAFVLFAAAAAQGTMDRGVADLLIIAVTASMLLTPLAFGVHARLIAPRFDVKDTRPFDTLEQPANPVIIAGFGRVGQIVGRVLRSRGIPFTAIEASAAQVDFVARFGSKVYYGDASRLDLLRAAEADKARAFVLAIDDPEASVRTASTVRRNFPSLPIYARARNRQHAFRLMDLRVEAATRETLHSSLVLAERVLAGLGLSDAEARDTVMRFKEHDEATLLAQHAIYRDEAKLIQTAKEAAEDLKRLFEADAARRGQPVAAAETGPEVPGRLKGSHPDPAKPD